MPVHVGFVVDKVALGQVFVGVLHSSPVTVIPSVLHTIFFHSSIIEILVPDSIVQ
jgi:hypothetical protein